MKKIMKSSIAPTQHVDCGLAVRAVALLVTFIAMPVLAQPPGQGPSKALTVTQEWKGQGTLHGSVAEGIVSPDGTLEAHLGPRAVDDGLYVKNIANGQDKLIVKEAGGFKEFDSIGFSPDGSRLIFRACPPLGAACPMPKIFTVGTDGSGLAEIGHSDFDKKTKIEYWVASPMFSPDGKEVLVDVSAARTETGVDEKGDRIAPTWTHYVGILSVNDTAKVPEKLVQGKPVFWNTDGSMVYYVGPEGLTRYDVQGKVSTPVPMPQGAYDILGKVPGTDAAFVRNGKDHSMTALNLNGSEVGQDLQEFAASVPTKDSEGRWLRSIDEAGPHHLVLRYDAGHVKPGVLRKHSQLVSFE
jgi:hypothetical protein